MAGASSACSWDLKAGGAPAAGDASGVARLKCSASTQIENISGPTGGAVAGSDSLRCGLGLADLDFLQITRKESLPEKAEVKDSSWTKAEKFAFASIMCGACGFGSSLSARLHLCCLSTSDDSCADEPFAESAWFPLDLGVGTVDESGDGEFALRLSVLCGCEGDNLPASGHLHATRSL